MLCILYEDEHIIVVWKPIGIESQSSRGFGADMVSEIRKHIHNLSTKNSTKTGEPYVGVIHRLDKPVSGVMVYAKDKKSAAALSKQAADGKMKKHYLAVLCGKPVDIVENYVDYLLKDGKLNTSRIVDMGITGAKRAELVCRALEAKDVEPYGTLTLAEIELMTGRHHQIRVQMAGHHLPIWGDNRYNPRFGGTIESIPERIPECIPEHISERTSEHASERADVALAAYRLAFTHPVTGQNMEFARYPEGRVFRNFKMILDNVQQ